MSNYFPKQNNSWTVLTAYTFTSAQIGSLQTIVMVLVVTVLVLIFAICSHIKEKRRDQEWRVYRLHQSWDKKLKQAQITALETEHFSPAWYKAAAKMRCDDLLAKAKKIRAKEAQRRIREKQVERKYEEIATYAAQTHELNESEVVEMLRNADKHQFRLLSAAGEIKIQEVA